MSQRASDYVFEGMQESKEFLKSSRVVFFKYFLFTLVSMIGKLFFFSFPLFALGEYFIANQIKEKKKFNIDNAFEVSKSIDKYWTTVLYALILHFTMITAVVLCVVLYFMFISLGTSIDSYMNVTNQGLPITFQLICGFLLLCMLAMINLYLSPALFLIQSNDDISLSEALHQSSMISFKMGKAKLLIIQLSHLFKLFMIALIFIGISFLSFRLLTILPSLLISFVLSIIWIMKIPRIVLSNKIASTKLFVDLTEEAFYQGLIKHHKKSVFFEKVLKENVLMNLFDEVSVNESDNETNQSNGIEEI